MGCASSTEVAASNIPVAEKKHREKKITAGTEAMAASTNHDTSTAVESYADSSKQQAAAVKKKDETEVAIKKKDDKEQLRGSSCSSNLVAHSAGSENLTVRYAWSSRRGRDPDDASKPNQDCCGVHHGGEGFVCAVGQKSDHVAAAFFGVYDGHGPHGELCSQFVKERLPQLIQRNMQKQHKNCDVLTIDQVQYSLHNAHTECNDELHACASINDKASGTTSISVYLHGEESGSTAANGTTRITVSNVGDSRAILGTGSAKAPKLQTVPLSTDHTPKRTDEAARCIESGARILSFGQIDPSTRDDDEGSEEIEDPPRVWSKKGKYPGTAFTRSMGDAVAETLGVYAEPEMLTLKLSANEKVIVLASDGVFDVLTNEEVMDLCFRHYPTYDPAQACKAVVEKSHQEWLLNEDCVDDEEAASYDDMTIICIFLDHRSPEEQKAAAAAAAATTGATTKKDDVDGQQPAPMQARKRVRQKTLRNLEEMEE